MNAPTRVMIADDHAILRAGLRALLSSHGDLAIVGEASDGAETIALWRETKPDVGLFDLNMPTLDGAEALRQIREHQPQAAVIMLTTLARDADIERAVGAGARAYLLKDTATSEIVACIRSVLNGDPRVLDHMKKRLSNRATVEPLTSREKEVLEGIATGRSNQCIATMLGIGTGTVKTHLKRIFGKLCARNRTEAVVIARERGLL